MTKFLRLNLQMFGANASKTTNLYSSAYPSSRPYTLTASFTEGDYNVNTNKSSVTVTALFKTPTPSSQSQYWTSGNNSTLEIYWYDNKTGSETLKGTLNFAGLSGYTDSKTVTATFDVEHKSDGTLSGYAKAVFTKGSTTSSYAPASGNAQTTTTALATIPRVSDVACTSPYVGDSATITISRKSTAFKDTLTYTIGALSGTIVTKTSNTTVAFNTSSIASSIYAQMGASNTQITGTITIYTYNGNTLIGSKPTTFTLYAKESACKPTVTATVVDANPTTIALTGDSNKIVKGYSTAQITYTITARNSASITSKKVNNATLGNSPYPIYNASTNVFNITATDTRNYSTTLPVTKTLVNYVTLSVNMNSLFRTTPTGSEAKVRFQGNYYNGSFGNTPNTLELKWKYRIKGSNTWTNGGTFVENTDYTISNNTFYSGTGGSASDIVLSSNLFSYQNVYEIAIFYKDKLVDSSTMKTLPKGTPAFNWEDNSLNVNGTFTISSNDGTNPKEIWEIIYPVGSIYISTNNINPHTFWGGTWVAFGTGRTLVGVDTTQTEFDTVEETGGEKTHTLTTTEMPNHRHTFKGANGVADATWLGVPGTVYSTHPTISPGSKGSTGGSITMTYEGGGGAHNNLQPYITVYMWKRTE